ncbi:hypothetical protein BDW75DRAFT_216850 [Aspergillus navahoensis]
MAARQITMLLYRILLYLSLTTNVLGSEQDILALDSDRLLLSSCNLVTKTCSYNSNLVIHVTALRAVILSADYSRMPAIRRCHVTIIAYTVYASILPLQNRLPY